MDFVREDLGLREYFSRGRMSKTTSSIFCFNSLDLLSRIFQEAVERLEANTSRQSSPKESDNGSASNSLDLEEAKVALNMEVKTA